MSSGYKQDPSTLTYHPELPKPPKSVNSYGPKKRMISQGSSPLPKKSRVSDSSEGGKTNEQQHALTPCPESPEPRDSINLNEL